MPGGRPSKLTPDVSKRICDAVKLGATYKDAAHYGGIHYDTFNEWMKAGQEAKSGKYAEFSDAVTRAEALGRVGLLTTIEQSARAGDWRAAAWKLERRDPEGYGPRMKLTGDSEHPVEVRTFGDLVDLAQRDASGRPPDRGPGEG